MPVVVPAPAAPRPRGRARSTSKDELGRIGLDLFIAHGFDAITVDDIAAAAGIGRRTFFRYFPSKNDVAWGDFERLLDAFRAALTGTPAEVPPIEAIRAAVRRFNEVPEDELDRHRHRMRILLETPELVAHSTVRYAEWRAVIADFIARRRGVPAHSALPQAVSWACLGISLAAYEQWLASDDDLLDLIDVSFAGLRDVFSDVALTGGSPGS
ncbi:mycofactocin system transcriptional regulator [Microbacterium sp. HD4P20]|uniref:mycofactocin system transcriptional regulator n=1 Tax=Microbacterium sp. HD4P20 TaxID=2864874 RepID=UPI001C64224F|nr:mycofactocin system transcriptional regulator [Microbacterium sp. HD4P20]MCP2636313.1 mycofactocin system transcriptional regulator [Microbacterium sp. HD4P20]